MLSILLTVVPNSSTYSADTNAVDVKKKATEIISQDIREKKREEQKEIDQMKDDPEVKKLLDSFPGIKIHSITNIKETIAEQEEKIQTSTKKEK